MRRYTVEKHTAPKVTWSYCLGNWYQPDSHIRHTLYGRAMCALQNWWFLKSINYGGASSASEKSEVYGKWFVWKGREIRNTNGGTRPKCSECELWNNKKSTKTFTNVLMASYINQFYWLYNNFRLKSWEKQVLFDLLIIYITYKWI